ncbi:MAG: class II aldolase/adducin family protein, partial [Acetobacteraceae bacterium]
MTTEAVADTYRELGRCGFVPGSAGNVSLRTADGMLITPSGCPADAVTPDTIVRLTLDGTVTGQGAPSS